MKPYEYFVCECGEKSLDLNSMASHAAGQAHDFKRMKTDVNPIPLAGGLARKKQNPDWSAMGKKGGWPKGKPRKK